MGQAVAILGCRSDQSLPGSGPRDGVLAHRPLARRAATPVPGTRAAGGVVTGSRRRVAVVGGAVAAVVALVLVATVAGLGGDDTPSDDGLATTAPLGSEGPDGSSAPAATVDPAAAAPVVGVEGTLERAGDDLVGRITLTNQGPGPIWIPVGTVGSSRPRLVPAAAGDGLIDLGWVVPPTPAADEDLDPPAVVFRPVAPGAAIELEATDAPPPPEALVDVGGEPVAVEGYRLCVDAFADAALVPDDRGPVEGDETAVAVEVDAIDGESTRTCGPSIEA